MDKFSNINYNINSQPIPSSFDEGYSQYETLSKLLTQVNSYIEKMNSQIDEVANLQALSNVLTERLNSDDIEIANHDELITAINQSISNINSQITQNTNSINSANETISEHTSLLDSHSAQLAENIQQSKSISVPYNYQGAVVTFVDDDGASRFLTETKPVLDSKGIKVTLGVITNNVGTSTYMTKEQLIALQSERHEIVSHTKTHIDTTFKAASYDLSLVTDTTIETEYKDSQQWLINNGFNGYNTLVFPWGNFGSQAIRYKRLARKYYKYALNASGNHNNSPSDNMYLNRYFINITQDFTTVLKPIIDAAVAANGWLIIGSHSGDATYFNGTYLATVIDYIKSLNIPIMTFGEALKYKGNALSIGEFTDSSNKLYVGNDGKNSLPGSNLIITPNTSTYTESSVITDFQADTITRFISLNTNSFGIAGVMEVFRSSSLYYSYATFTPYNSNVVYMRKWNDITHVWDAWKALSPVASLATLATTLSGFVVSTSLDVNIARQGNLVNGTISLSNAANTGSFAFNDILATFDFSFAPARAVFVPLTILTGTGTYRTGYATIEANGTTNTVLKAQKADTGGDIKWMIANLSYYCNR